MKSIVDYINEGKRWDKFKKGAKNFWYDICTIVDGTAASMGIVCDKLDDYTSETDTIESVKQALNTYGADGTYALVDNGYVCDIAYILDIHGPKAGAKLRRAFETDGHFNVFTTNKNYAWFVPGLQHYMDATGENLAHYDEEDIVKSYESRNRHE